MKAEWTSTTPAVATVTLGDDAARHTIEIESAGGAAQEQVTPIFRAANAQRKARANVAGELTLVCAKSHADVDAAATYFLGEYGRINQVGTLLLTFSAGTVTAAGATLKGVEIANTVGVRWWLRYRFGITTLS